MGSSTSNSDRLLCFAPLPVTAPVLDSPATTLLSPQVERSQQSERCLQCGGSGQLRTGAAACKTCLPCAGSGVLQAMVRKPVTGSDRLPR
jgi:hypothetical protein